MLLFLVFLAYSLGPGASPVPPLGILFLPYLPRAFPESHSPQRILAVYSPSLGE